VKFPITFYKKEKNRFISPFGVLFLIKMEEKNNTNNTTPVPDLTEMEEVRKAIIANEILTRKY